MKQDVEDMYPTNLGHTIKVFGISNLHMDTGYMKYMYFSLFRNDFFILTFISPITFIWLCFQDA